MKGLEAAELHLSLGILLLEQTGVSGASVALPIAVHRTWLQARSSLRVAMKTGISGSLTLHPGLSGGMSPWILGWGCIVKCKFMPVVSFCPADISGIDWMVRHGRSLALSVAVNVAPSRLCAGKHSNEIQDMILSNAVADRVRLGPVLP